MALAAQEALERLSDDDSRRVSGLATETLATYAAERSQQQPAGERPVAEDAELAQPGPGVDQRRTEEDQREQERQERLKALYQVGAEAAQAEEWAAATDAFRQVVALDNGCENAAARLEEVEAKENARKGRQERLRALYQVGAEAAQAEEWAAATDAFRQVVALDNGYENAAARLEEVEAKENARKERQERLRALYQVGAEAEEWAAAIMPSGR